LGRERAPGEVNSVGIRHESLTGLSFEDNSFDFILSFDVFEHIPDYKAAIKECLRVLRPGGQMLFSVPFCFDSYEHIVRAYIREDGNIEHLMEPEYHGDPVNSGGCLCFYHFGWKILDEFKGAGFNSARALFYWSEKFGYLGLDQALFIATKPF
jgi:SAM-dependent methyltransferase